MTVSAQQWHVPIGGPLLVACATIIVATVVIGGVGSVPLVVLAMGLLVVALLARSAYRASLQAASVA
jgi:TRAP-type mannitol/chloroaromatic compound transport system permease large subunit